ncbi:RNA polymerase sigma factor [Tunicatimonas pelagia]|uniref:RNA polymerase sigma factor n=1 Tax=Tunicatimonas pelagia TaxID=931531 RepID=UPI002666E01F|nr:RNA polymerase sigma factor [Tunicatimonas pelagia]WKN42889.1 RNA polymerase sigma factor [Tunicatimonas pelagia]
MELPTARLRGVMNIKTFKSNVFPVQAKLYRFAKTMLHDDEEAEDAVQEALLKLWLNRSSLTSYKSIEALAMVVTKNLCLDKLKSSYRKKVIPLTETVNTTDGTTPYQKTELANTVVILRELMGQLPEQQRLVIHLRDVEEYSYEEIEQVTGLSINNIRVTLSRARRSVREMYTKVNAYGS